MKNLLAAGKCHLPEPTLAEPVSIRMSPTPPEDFSAGRRQQRQDPCSHRNAAPLREISSPIPADPASLCLGLPVPSRPCPAFPASPVLCQRTRASFCPRS